MALIKPEHFIKMEKCRNSVHKPTKATYTVFEENEHKYFQIDTYGSNDREMPEKISQSIQVDEEMSELLISVLHRELFNK